MTGLGLEPLSASDIRQLIQARLEVEVLPEALAHLVMERSEGNPLFAEEIVSFLTERGVLRAGERKVEFDHDAVATALPVSVQSLLTARVDRLALQARPLLQAAAVIGRRFDSRLLAAVDGGWISSSAAGFATVFVQPIATIRGRADLQNPPRCVRRRPNPLPARDRLSDPAHARSVEG